jgi:hypothetical protein
MKVRWQIRLQEAQCFLWPATCDLAPRPSASHMWEGTADDRDQAVGGVVSASWKPTVVDSVRQQIP